MASSEAGRKRVEQTTDSEGEEPVQKKTKPKLSSSCVHKEFDRVEVIVNGGKEVNSKCKHCAHTVKGKNTTNTVKHLESKHPAIATKVKKKDDEDREEIAKAREEAIPKSSSNKQVSSNALMMKFLGRGVGNLPPRSKEKEEESLKATTLWIAGSSLPLSTVDDPAYERVLKTYDSQVK